MEDFCKGSSTAKSFSDSQNTPSTTQHKRNEARENAKRDRTGSDWFRHDRPNTPTTPLLSEYGESYADASCTGSVTPLRQQESTGVVDLRKCLSRGSGYSPSPSRLPFTDGLHPPDRRNCESKVRLRFDKTPDKCVVKTPLSAVSFNSAVKQSRSNPNDWFRHDQKSPDLNKAVDEDDLIATLDEIDDDNDVMKTVPSGAAKTSKEVHTLPNNGGACSCGGDWFLSHDENEMSSKKACCHVYRGHPKDGELNPALRSAQESESWFDYEANKNYFSPVPPVRGAGVPSMLNRERSGQQMSDILHMK